MENYRCLLLAVLVDILQIELSWQTEVELTCRECILISYGRLNIYIKLWSVECSLTDLLCVIDSYIIKNFSKCILCFVPHLIVIVILYLVLWVTE